MPNSDWSLDTSSSPINYNVNSDWSIDNGQPSLMDKITSQLAKSQLISAAANYFQKPVSEINNFVESARLPSLAGGLLQGGADTAISLANVPLEMINIRTIPHPNLQQYLPQDILSKAAFTGGNIGGSLIGAGGVYNKVGELMPELSGYSRMLGNVAKGATTGALTGEEAPYGREGGAILGGAIPTINMIRPSVIGNTILNAKNSAQNFYRNAYNDLFKTADINGLSKTDVPDIDFDYLKENIPKKFIKSSEEFRINPTPENAHWAQSDLGKYINKMKNNTNVVSSQVKAVNEASNAKNLLMQEIQNTFSKRPDLNLNNTYNNLTTGYARDVIPYTSNPHISKFLDGKMSKRDMVKGLSTDFPFMQSKGSQFPELKLFNFVGNPMIQRLIQGAAGGLGFGTAYDYYNHIK